MLGFAAVPSLASAATSTQKCNDPVQERIAGTFTDTTGLTTVRVDACATLQRINSDGDAVLRVVGTVTNTATGVTTTFTDTAVAPLQVTGTCEILDLVIGPIHLDLLGLVVDVNQIEINITAEQGPGNLLGNLLCAVAGLLDPGPNPGDTLVQQVIALLNQILGVLSNL
jgi:hypothetical protein